MARIKGPLGDCLIPEVFDFGKVVCIGDKGSLVELLQWQVHDEGGVAEIATAQDLILLFACVFKGMETLDPMMNFP